MHTRFSAENLKGRDHSEDLRHRWEDNIRMDHEDIGVDWMHLTQDRYQLRVVLNTVMSIRLP